MMRKFSLALLLAGTVLLLSVPVVRADSFDVTLSPNSFTVVQGTTTIDVFGTITNTSTADTLSLDGDGLSAVSSSITFNDFFYTSPDVPLTLAAGGSSGSIDLFQIVLDPSIAVGSYLSNSYYIFGTDPNGNTVSSNTALFDVNVTSPIATPEPGTLFLLGSGLALLVGRRRRIKA